jgi:hypothetical protein
MSSKHVVSLIAGTMLAVAAPAHAEDAAAGALASPASPTTVQTPSSDEPAVLSNDELGVMRGGESIAVTNQTLVAITSGNVINGDYAAGNISLSDNAFSNFNGLGNVLINTGAQVSLQTGMNVTINVSN